MDTFEAAAETTTPPSALGETEVVFPDSLSTETLPHSWASEGCDCGTPGGTCVCGAAGADLLEANPEILAPPYVYAIGRIEPRVPTEAVAKELAQVTGQAETAGLTDRQVLREVLSQRENRYLARQFCFVLRIGGLDTYILRPRDPFDFDQLIDAVRAEPGPDDLDLVIGFRGPIAPPEMCHGVPVPLLGFDQIYSFDRNSLIKSIPRPQGMTSKQFEPAAKQVLDQIMLIADNAGGSDQHRALNYLAVRYPEVYARTADAFARDFAFIGVDVLAPRVTSVRALVDVVFKYRSRTSDYVEKFFARVDVTEEFPFLVTPLTQYVEH